MATANAGSRHCAASGNGLTSATASPPTAAAAPSGLDSELVDTSEVLVRDPEALAHEREARANDPDRVTRVPLATADAIIGFKPERVVDRISPRPAFFIGVADDTLVPTEETLALFARAREPKRLHLFPAIGHHAVYYGDRLDELLGMAVDWFDEHLKTVSDGEWHDKNSLRERWSYRADHSEPPGGDERDRRRSAARARRCGDAG